ncbi:MAG: KUP/HAK/KT family potassium transporter, partial [Xanthobacteraceae bacterium]
AAAHKILDGGWFPLAIAAVVFAAMLAWRRGRDRLRERLLAGSPPLAGFLGTLLAHPPQRIAGTAVFLTSSPQVTPSALLHSLKHYKVLHEKNVIVTIRTEDTPRVDEPERVQIEPLGKTFSRVLLRFGFMETPSVPKALAIARRHGWHFDIMSTSFFLSRRTLKPAAASGMARWQNRLFIALARSANDATDYFQIPTGRVVEVGTQVTV